MDLETYLELMEKYDFVVIKHRNNGLWPVEVDSPLDVFDKYGGDVAAYKAVELKI